MACTMRAALAQQSFTAKASGGAEDATDRRVLRACRAVSSSWPGSAGRRRTTPALPLQSLIAASTPRLRTAGAAAAGCGPRQPRSRPDQGHFRREPGRRRCVVVGAAGSLRNWSSLLFVKHCRIVNPDLQRARQSAALRTGCVDQAQPAQQLCDS